MTLRGFNSITAERSRIGSWRSQCQDSYRACVCSWFPVRNQGTFAIKSHRRRRGVLTDEHLPTELSRRILTGSSGNTACGLRATQTCQPLRQAQSRSSGLWGACDQIARLAGLLGGGGWGGSQAKGKAHWEQRQDAGNEQKRNLNSVSITVKCQPPGSNLKQKASTLSAKACSLMTKPRCGAILSHGFFPARSVVEVRGFFYL